jgi:hypothetical protein
MILLTPCIINPRKTADDKARAESARKAKEAEERIADYEKIIRAIAREEGWPVAENNALQQQARRDGKEVMSDDGIHPNYLGQSLIARSILDALGHKDVALPKTFEPKLFPGVVRKWQMRLAPLDDKKRPVTLDAAAGRALRPDADWVTYTLPDGVPEAKPTAEDWWEQERRNGFGLQLEKKVGKGRIQAVALLEEKQARKAYVNTGIGISSVWLNGVKIHSQGSAWTGFHAGKERLPIELKAGQNVLVVEIDSPQFFLSVTEQLIWEEDL